MPTSMPSMISATLRIMLYVAAGRYLANSSLRGSLASSSLVLTAASISSRSALVVRTV